MHEEPLIIKSKYKDTSLTTSNKDNSGYIYHFIFDKEEYSVLWSLVNPDIAIFMKHVRNSKTMPFYAIPYKNVNFRYILSYFITTENIHSFSIYIYNEGYQEVDYKEFLRGIEK